jgi:hypothetical protein
MASQRRLTGTHGADHEQSHATATVLTRCALARQIGQFWCSGAWLVAFAEARM